MLFSCKNRCPDNEKQCVLWICVHPKDIACGIPNLSFNQLAPKFFQIK